MSYTTKNTFVHIASVPNISPRIPRNFRSYSLPVLFDPSDYTPSTECTRRSRFPTSDCTTLTIAEGTDTVIDTPSPEFSDNRFFVGGLSDVTTGETLKEYFSMFGAVEDAAVIMDKRTKQSRGFGFVTFQHHVAVDSLKNATHVIDSKQAGVRPYGRPTTI